MVGSSGIPSKGFRFPKMVVQRGGRQPKRIGSRGMDRECFKKSVSEQASVVEATGVDGKGKARHGQDGMGEGR